jgi:thioredoxin-like negative regulator of GroEL
LDANGILKVVAKHSDKKADLEIDFKEDLLNTTATRLYQNLNQLVLTSEDDDASVSRVRAKTNLCITLEKVRHIADYVNLLNFISTIKL